MAKPDKPPGKPDKPLPPEAITERDTAGELVGGGSMLRGTASSGLATVAPASGPPRIYSISLVLP